LTGARSRATPPPGCGRLAYGLQAAVLGVTLALLRALPLDWASGLGGFVARHVGPLVPVSRVGRRNLRAAFPDKSDAEIERILVGVWDNLGRVFAEYPHLDRIWDVGPEGPLPGGRIQTDDMERFRDLRDSGRPGIFFTAHCGNWELLPIGAERHGLKVAVVYRAPNNPYAAELVRKIRERSMGRLLPTGMLGTRAAAEAMDKGEHLGILVDQYYSRGLDLPFFGRPARTAPALAKIALRYDSRVAGAFVERLGGARFRLHIMPPLALPRTGDPEADELALMTEVTKQVEDWDRAHPDQWLWLHRRWR